MATEEAVMSRDIRTSSGLATEPAEPISPVSNAITDWARTYIEKFDEVVGVKAELGDPFSGSELELYRLAQAIVAVQKGES